MRKRLLVIGLVLAAAGCAGPAGDNVIVSEEPAGANCPTGGVRIQGGTSGAATYICNGATGASPTVSSEPPGANCAAGGVKIEVGTSAPSYVCNGESGTSVAMTPEPAGSNCANGGVRLQIGTGAPSYVCAGATGESVATTPEAPGANCANGGVQVKVGNGQPTYVCNGIDGTNATVTSEPAGANCAAGGVKIRVGGGEPTYVCHGVDGESATVATEPPGENCGAGGVKIQVGNGIPTYACNGAPGDGATVSAEPTGANCANGGVKIQVGSGTPSYVCNGVNGLDGQGASVSVEPPGANCAHGGIAVQVGDDPATYVCNGSNGQSASVTPEPAGDDCQYGGVKVQIGTDPASHICNASAPGACTGVPLLAVTSFTMSSGMPFTATVTTLYPGGIRPLSYTFMGDGGTYTQIGTSNHFSFVPTSSGGPYTNFVAVSDGCQVATGSLHDLYTPPGDVTNLAHGALADTSVPLTWNDPANANLDHLEVTWAGGSATAAKASGTNGTVVTGLAQGTAYTFTVKAADAHGNRSAGQSVSATTGCSTGYGWDGATCVAVDNCLTANGGCDASATCTMTGPGTNSCACTTGYSGNGQTCTAINSCLTSNGGCDANATCTSTGPGTNSCTCNTGYSGSGQTCTGINSCLSNNGGCDANATCTQTGPGTSSCACNTGYSGNGQTCSAAGRTLNLSFSGSGSVAVSSPSATCSSGACTYDVPDGALVTLTASPAEGWTFGIWSGCDSVNGLECTVTMNQDRTIATGFNFNTFTLAASFAGSGGTITSNPAGLDCGNVCSAAFNVGDTIRLIAVPASSAYYVSSWTGCTSYSGATCDVTMNSNKSVVAVFSPSPTGWTNACEQAGGTQYYADGWHDDEFTQVPIGFSYAFDGQTYSDAWVSTNALITFDSGDWTYSNPPMSAGVRRMALFWDDLVTQDPGVVPGSSICVATTGNAPDRQFVVTWNKMGFYGSTDNTALTFSAVLHETTNAVDYYYYDLSSPQGTRGLGDSATIGISWTTGYEQLGYNQSVVSNGLHVHYDAH